MAEGERVEVGVSSPDRTFCPLPRDDHLPAIPPLNEEAAVPDLTGGHRLEQEPPVQRGRVETARSAQQRLVLQAPRPAKALP